MYNTDLPTRAELPSTGKLLRSTAIAALTAAVLLVTTILPAEYGIDPTGVGHALGLTHMGEIKHSLAEEASAEAVPVIAIDDHGHDHASDRNHDHDHGNNHDPDHGNSLPSTAVPTTPSPSEAVQNEVATARQHTVTFSLQPGEAAEIKLTMQKDASVEYEWIAVGGPVNYDTHGDPVNAPQGAYHGYGKGRNETKQAGTLQAAFDGKHGWFWRNRSGAEVTVTLKTRGDYGQIERVL